MILDRRLDLKNKLKRAIFMLSLVFLVTGCASVPKTQPQVDAYSASAQYENALKILNSGPKSYGKNNELLYLLDKAIIEHFAGHYSESIETFSRAQQIFDQLYTESISKIAATWVINDYAAPYHGEDFESVFINIFQSLNYLKISKSQEALVEARDVDSKLGAINNQYADDQKNVYKEDAFARLLMGIIYEMENTREGINDAFISYQKALQTYENDYEPNYGVGVPKILKENILTAARDMGFSEFGNYKEKFNDIQLRTIDEKRNKGELYLIQYNGVCPEKIEESVPIPTFDGYMIKMAFPKYRNRPYAVSYSRIHAYDAKGALISENTELVQDIGKIATENLKRRRLRFIAKSAARATSKYLIAKKQEESIKKKNNNVMAGWFNFFANLYNIVSEQADLRSWQTLPDQIRMARLLLPPGEYTLVLEHFNSSGENLGQLNLPAIKISAGEKQFIVTHTTR